MMVSEQFIKPNKGFQSSVNIAFDLHNKEKVQSLIPTSTVCHYVEELLKDVISRSNQRAKMLVGAYGKGKSHITLAALEAMSTKDPSVFFNLTEAFEAKGSGFTDSFVQFVSDGPRLLPVVISGSSSDLSRSFLYALKSSLSDLGLEGLMPQTNYDGALNVLERWEREFPETLRQLQIITGFSGSVIKNMIKEYDTQMYSEFVNAYPKLTSGGSFDSLQDSDVIGVYTHVLNQLKRYKYDGIYVVYDEFSKYLESSITTAGIEDIKLLQDFAELCNRSTQDKQLHLLLISHKNLSNYIDTNLPKEKVDGWRGISGRFVELEIYDNSNQSYELMASAIGKDEIKWSKFLESNKGTFEALANRYVASNLVATEDVKSVVEGCYPLHPVTTFLLPRVSEIVAQNERTLFTFLSASESNSLPQRCEAGDLLQSFVTPDYVYDYFEPQLRREYYSSDAHSTYVLSKAALTRVEKGSLEARIIKTIAMIYLVAQFNVCPPTKTILVDLFMDAGFDRGDVLRAFDNLIDLESIVYMKRSNSYVKLKECSGEKVDENVHNVAEKLKANNDLIPILNSCLSGRAMYPSRHNTKNKITRYFECIFEDADIVSRMLESGEQFACNGDGLMVAVVSNDENVSNLVLNINKCSHLYPTTVFVVLKNQVDVSMSAYKYAAAMQLMAKASDDEVLRDEYSIIVEDYSEILSSYIAKFFIPEKHGSLYYFPSGCYDAVRHRKKLSSLLSDLCDEVYSKTPVINNEAINKNYPTAIALKSRSKILMALCSKSLEPNLGFIGSGQETSIARSVLAVTGVIPELETNPVVLLDSSNGFVGSIIEEVENFIKTGDGLTFDCLYKRLTLPEYGIGAKRGPLPIFIALVMRNYIDSVCIMCADEECAFSKQTLEDIDSSPELYMLHLVDWDNKKSDYVEAVGRIFNPNAESFHKQKVTEDARSWFVSLPQFTRLSRINHSVENQTKVESSRIGLFKAVNKPVLNPNEFLFDDLPKVFGESEANEQVVSRLAMEVEKCNNYINECGDVALTKIKSIVKPDALPTESLCYVFEDWLEINSECLSTHVFSGSGNKIMSAISAFDANQKESLKRLCKACVSLRMEDWDDRLYKQFFNTMNSFIEEVNSVSKSSLQGNIATQSIEFISDNGVSQVRTFEHVEYSRRASLLKNEILNSIDEMGQSINKDEVRQVIFEVLKGMC